MTDPKTIVTPPCRLQFSSLFKARPKAVDQNGRKVFQACILIPAEVDIRPFQAAMLAAIEEAGWDKSFRLPAKNNPLKDAGEKEGQYPGFLAGWHYINASSGMPIGVVDQTTAPIVPDIVTPWDLKEAEEAGEKPAASASSRIFDGCWARFFLSAYTWDHRTGGKGVSFSLGGVQLVREDEALGKGQRNVADVFGAIEVPGQDATAGGASSADDGDDPLAAMFGGS